MLLDETHLRNIGDGPFLDNLITGMPFSSHAKDVW
jgi:hypothetical protein